MEYLVEIRNITKVFPGTVALDDVSFKIRRGEVHAVIGENGAGKSTLMKILVGAYAPDGGKLIIDGKEYDRLTPALADKLGIRIVYQELNQVPELTVANNMLLGQESFFLKDRAANEQARHILHGLQIYDVDPRAKLGTLSIGKRQLIEIAKASIIPSKLIIMDEPTSSLTNNETSILLQHIRKLCSEGCTVIYISHKLDEIMDIADRITIMRDGRHVKTVAKQDITIDEMIQLMVNRKMGDLFPPHSRTPGEIILEVSHLHKPGLVEDAGFQLRRGEVLGFIGLMGCGRTELFETLFGVHGKYDGDVTIEGKPCRIASIQDAIKNGLGYITEDRKRNGIVGPMSVSDNLTLVNLENMLHRGIFTDKKAELMVCEEYKQKLKIKTPNFRKMISELSGGNQQKIIISKWIMRQPKIFILDEPTRGIDVGSKYEIYEIMNDLVNQGISIIFISSETEEIVNMCDRAVIMSHHKTIAVLEGATLTADNILQECFNGEMKHAQ